MSPHLLFQCFEDDAEREEVTDGYHETEQLGTANVAVPSSPI